MPATAEKAAPERASDAINVWCFKLESFAQRLYDDDISWSDDRHLMDDFGASGGEYGTAYVLKGLAEGLKNVGETGPVGSPFEAFVNDNARLLDMAADHLARVGADLEAQGEPVDAAACRALASELSAMRREWWAAISARREAPSSSVPQAVDLEALRAWLLDSLRSSSADLDPCGPGEVERVLHLDAARWSVSEAFSRYANVGDAESRPAGGVRSAQVLADRDAAGLAQLILKAMEDLARELRAGGALGSPEALSAPVIHLDAATWAVETWLDRFERSEGGSDA